jgi:hypothetical protein
MRTTIHFSFLLALFDDNVDIGANVCISGEIEIGDQKYSL